MSAYNFTTDIVIGLEIHVELNTKTKLFCACPTSGSEEPNTRTCPICLGHPGSKPVLNEKVLEYAVKLGLALDCEIDRELWFSRKNYFYPDLAKNYQISQFERPLCKEGKLVIETEQGEKEVGITRIHIEEDPASLVHPGNGLHGSAYTLIDYNRSGNALCEIVTEPQLTSPEEAREFMKKLITILDYLGVFDVNEGIIKADANISIKESGYVRSEVKNITGFKDIERALFYEIDRQRHAVKEGEKLIPDTRSWNTKTGTTARMRSKESEDDYGYIIDPDLVVTHLEEDYISKIKDSLPELATEKKEKFVSKHNISKEMAEVLSKDKELAAVFEEVCEEINPDLASKWIRRELGRVLNYNKKKFSEVALTSKHFIDLLKLIEEGKITEKVGQQILNNLVLKPFDVVPYVKEQGLEQISDSSAIEGFCKEVIDEQPDAVAQLKGGEQKAMNFLVGQIMRKSKGAAKPAEVNQILRKLLEL